MFRPGGKEGKMRQGFLKKFKEPGGLAGRILKWQTVTLANGMDFEFWGPVSAPTEINKISCPEPPT